MKTYQNLNLHSGVTRYLEGPDFIAVEFADDHLYLYNYEKPGVRAVEKMKELAERGEGLSSYISSHVREKFAARLR